MIFHPGFIGVRPTLDSALLRLIDLTRITLKEMHWKFSTPQNRLSSLHTYSQDERFVNGIHKHLIYAESTYRSEG